MKYKIVASMKDDVSYAFTGSEEGLLETLVLMHSPQGVRVEWSLERSRLSLWISPQAGKEPGCRFRNFSCRDDHTSIFDRIEFPELGRRRFLGCDYDPFHSVLRFDRQALHLAVLVDTPAVLVWFERPELVDLKSDKQDAILKRTESVFAVRHPDRGLTLDFCAVAARGEGCFQHQPEVMAGRSTYSRIGLGAGQVLVLGAELAKEKILARLEALAGKPAGGLLAGNEAKIARSLKPGTAVFRDRPEMQRLYDMNKRHLLSAQDASGAIRAALKYIYYLIWATDGSVTATSLFQTGWRSFLERWMEFLLANPTEQAAPPKGRFYGQLVNPRITKREEFGTLCAVWPAFMHWGLTGDRRFVSGRNLALLGEVVDWLERYCWDSSLGAMGSFYQAGGSEDPFFGSNDFGWDSAVGRPMARTLYAPRYKGKVIIRAYEFAFNLNYYNMLLMLSAVLPAPRREACLRKARKVETYLSRLVDLKIDGYYRLHGGKLAAISPGPESQKGLFAVQSRSAAFFMPRFAELYLDRMRNFKRRTRMETVDKMPCYYYGLLAGLDTEFVKEKDVVASIEVSLKYHIRPSKYFPMPYTMVEMMGEADGQFHDIRPQAFSAGPFQAAVANLCVKTMPFGIGLRATTLVSEFRNFEYLEGSLDVVYRGRGTAVGAVLLNGRELVHTLQIPVSRFREGSNRAEVRLADRPAEGVCLVYSTVKLLAVSSKSGFVEYSVEAICQNVLIFRSLGRDPEILGSPAGSTGFSRRDSGRHSFVEFKGRGRFRIRIPV